MRTMVPGRFSPSNGPFVTDPHRTAPLRPGTDRPSAIPPNPGPAQPIPTIPCMASTPSAPGLEGDPVMAIDHETRTSRRNVLAAALGGAGAIVASKLIQPA